jgi:pyrroloquinoline quinone (PQQ) biosynthesis protein C
MIEKSGCDAYVPCFAIHNDDIRFKIDQHVKPATLNEKITGFNCIWRKIYFDADQVDAMTAVLALLEENLTCAEIAFQSSLSLAMVRSILQTLYELGIIVLDSDDDMPALAFYRHATNRLRAHRHRIIAENPILTVENSAHLSKRQLLGFLVESYHFVAAVSSHISAAIVSAPTNKLRHHFSKYLAEEYWHNTLLKKGLLKAGIKAENLDNSIPSIPLMGIIHFLRYLAQTDLEAYGLCVSLSEGQTSPGAIPLHRKEIWGLVQHLELIPDDAVDVFIEHDLMDFDGKHDDVPKILFEGNAPLSPTRQRELLKTGTLYIEMVRHAYEYLKSVYQDPTGDPWISLEIP